MKYLVVSLCFISVLFFAALAVAQNGAYSSYYSYTVSYNPDGSANVTPTAEVNGIDDVSDWVEGSYRPVCNVKPKIQLNGDANWVFGQGWGLGHAVDQIHTGSAVYVPADGSTVALNYSVEVDVRCSGAPGPTYYQYPGLVNLPGWSWIDINYWYLLGFSPFQTSPPYNVRYCPSAVVCPVGYGVASINNFVDFADFLNEYERIAKTKAKYNGEYLIDIPSGNVLCEVDNMCTAATTPPLCSLPGNEVKVDTNPATCTTRSPWWCGQLALRLPGSQIWNCLGVLFAGPVCVPADNRTQPEDCTH
jgi:hypothetical protein